MAKEMTTGEQRILNNKADYLEELGLAHLGQEHGIAAAFSVVYPIGPYPIAPTVKDEQSTVWDGLTASGAAQEGLGIPAGEKWRVRVEHCRFDNAPTCWRVTLVPHGQHELGEVRIQRDFQKPGYAAEFVMAQFTGDWEKCQVS